jgi:hypothetical protein
VSKPECPPELEAAIRADERQQCVDYLYATPGLEDAARLLAVRMHGLARGPAESGRG